MTTNPISRLVKRTPTSTRRGELPLRGLSLVLLLPLLIGAGPRHATAQEEPGALPYDLAFDMREFLWSGMLAVTADGNRVAYAVRQAPADVNLDARFMPNGSPSSVVGARLYITDRQAGSTIDICPGGTCWRPVWSPDGRRLAFYSDVEGSPQLWVYEMETGESRRVSPARVKVKLWAGDEPQWSPDGRTVYVPLAPASGPGAWLPSGAKEEEKVLPSAGPTVTVLRHGSERDEAAEAEDAASPMREHYLRENNASMAAIDVRTGEVRLLVSAATEPRPSVLRLSPSGRWLSYLSVFQDQGITSQVSTMDLAVVPTAGGEVRMVVEDLPVLRDYHRLNYSWHPSQDRLVYLKDGQLWLVEVGSDGPSAPRRLAVELGELAPTLNWFARDGRAVVVGIDPVDDKGYRDPRPRGIAIVPLDGGEPVRLPIDDHWVYADIVKAGARTVWQPDGASITLVLTEKATGETGIVRIDPRTGRSRILWKGLARLDNLTAAASHDLLFGMYQDIGTPPNVYRFAADFSGKERISHIDPRLDEVATGTVEVFETTVPLYDGSLGTVRSAVLLPPGAERGDRLPAIVTVYPGGDVSRSASVFGGGGGLTVPNLVFTSRGFAVLLVHLKLGPNGEAGNPLKEMVDVLLPQVYRAAGLGYVDVERLAVGGQSFGGYGTAAIISGTNLFRAAVAVSGIYDLAGTYGHLDEEGGSFWIGWAEGGQARMGTHPWANLRRYLENSPYYRADKIHTPLLLIHGDEDMAYHDAQKLFSALRRLDRPVQLASYAGQGHVIFNWSQANAIDAAQRIVEFLRERLGEPAVAATEREAG